MAPLGTCKTGCSREKTEGKSDSWTSSHGGHGTIDSPDFVTGEELVEFAIPGEGNATEKGHALNGGGVDRPRCFDGVFGIYLFVSQQHNNLKIVCNRSGTDASVRGRIGKIVLLNIIAFMILQQTTVFKSLKE